jgi:hypothetical protein
MNDNLEQVEGLSKTGGPNTAVIRQLLNEALSDGELNTLCYDHFRPVYDQFSSGMSRGEKIQCLIEYCDRHRQMDELLALVQKINPDLHTEYGDRYRNVTQPAQGLDGAEEPAIEVSDAEAPSSQTIDLATQWLTELKFSTRNPFQGQQAETDQFLQEHFLRHPLFDELMLDQHTTLCSARGSGKTSLRMMVKRDVVETVFVIEVTDLYELANDLDSVSLGKHVQQILRAGVDKLFELICSRKKWAHGFCKLRGTQKSLFLRYLHDYVDKQRWLYLLDYALVNRSLPSIDELQKSDRYVPAEEEDVMVAFAIDVLETDAGSLPSLAQNPTRLLNDFREVVNWFGFNKVFVLYDNIDGYDAVQSPQDANKLLDPLLSARSFFNSAEGIYFKFFLPSELSALLRKTRTVVSGTARWLPPLTWSYERLEALYRRRLLMASENRHDSLAPITEPSLRADIDRELIKAVSSPRELLLLGQFLFDSYFRNSSDYGNELISWRDLEDAKRDLRDFITGDKEAGEDLPQINNDEDSRVGARGASHVKRLVKIIASTVAASVLGIATNIIATYLQERFNLLNNQGRFAVVVVVFLITLAIGIWLAVNQGKEPS